LSGSRANSQTRLNKISQDNHKTGQFTPVSSLLQGLTLGGSRTSLAKLGKNNSCSTNDDVGGILVKKNFSASVQCLTQNNSTQGITNAITNGGGLTMQGLNSGSRVNISNILNSGQTSSNAHLFYTKNQPAPLVRGPGMNPKYGSAVNLSGNVDDRSLEGQKRGNNSKSRTQRAGSQSRIDNDYRSGSNPPEFQAVGTPCQLEYPNRFRGSSDYVQIQMEEFKAKYEVTGIIGRGGGGTVYSGYRRLDRSPCAIKQVPKVKVKRWGRINNLKVPIEFDLLNRVNRKHSSIIEMLDWYERRSSFVLVMERPPHSIDLFEFINRRGAVEEFNTKYMLRQLVEVMIILFKEGVFHRDVKDENIMVSYDNFQLKLIDFGCGTNLKKSDYTEFAGTPEFYPPEWFREKRYSAETQTVWSLGVLLWAMLHGEVPFANEGDIKVYKGSVYELKRRVQLTEDTMHFLQKLLNFDERKRPTLRQLINSRWLRKNSEGDEKLSITPAYEGSSLRKSSNKHENSSKHSNSKQQHQTTSHQDLSSYATSHNPQHSQHQHFASTTQLSQKKEEGRGGGQHHNQHRSSKQNKNNSYNRSNTSLFQTSAATAVAPPPTLY
jgi:serine/threonine protein kinase